MTEAWHFSDSWHFFSKHSPVSSVLAFVVVCFCHVNVTRCVMFLGSVMEVSCLPAQYFSGLEGFPWQMTDLSRNSSCNLNEYILFQGLYRNLCGRSVTCHRPSEISQYHFVLNCSWVGIIRSLHWDGSLDSSSELRYPSKNSDEASLKTET